MGTKNHPGNYDRYAKAHPDEPLFVLRGKDPTAPLLVELWASLREHTLHCPKEKLAEAWQCAQSMREWYNDTDVCEDDFRLISPGNIEPGEERTFGCLQKQDSRFSRIEVCGDARDVELLHLYPYTRDAVSKELGKSGPDQVGSYITSLTLVNLLSSLERCVSGVGAGDMFLFACDALQLVVVNRASVARNFSVKFWFKEAITL